MATGRLPDPNSAPVTAKGDLYTYSTVPAKLAVGNNGETLVADSSASTGLRWQGNYAAGKNAIINGAFDIWQRGTSFTATGYTADRFRVIVGNSTTVSRQTFTAGAAPVAGYEGQYFLRLQRTTSTTSDYITQKIENVQTFAGQNVNLSFWAKADAGATVTSVYLEQNFGSGGSGSVATGGNSPVLTTSWQRFSFQYTIPSISGKTIGSSSFLDLVWNFGSGMGNRTIDIWGVQVEAGSVATAFQTATGTLAGELCAAQRYYYRTDTGGSAYRRFASGQTYSATQALIWIPFPVTMRTAPTALEQSGTASHYALMTSTGNTAACTSVPAFDTANANGGNLICVASGLGSTAGYATQLFANNTSSAYLAWSAEL